jgi:xanthine dehydrogenase accessory factor
VEDPEGKGSRRITVTAIVLAAGEATRFGECKQLVRLGSRTLLEHALENLRASKIDDVVVVLGANAEEIKAKTRFDRERVILNPDYAQGMSTSIQAGLRAIAADAVLIVLADQPFVRPDTVDLLVDEYFRTRASVVIPTFNGFRGNPVVIDKSLFPEMMNLRGDTGCRAIFGDHPDSIVKVPVDDAGVIADIDTQDQLQSIQNPKPKIQNRADLLETIVDLRRRRQPFAIATVVRAERPTSSKPGDKAIIAPDGTLTGWIGGSCAHDIVVRNSLEALQEGEPRFLTLSSRAEAKRFGVIDVPMQCYSGGVLDVFIEPQVPRPHMVVVGYETIARALVRISKTLQFDVTVVDPLATKAAVPEADEVINELVIPPTATCVVVATHGRYDEDAIERAARTGASYIALVASPKRAAVILQSVRERGVDVTKVKSPAGLDIGAEGAEEIALSIVAEIVQRKAKPRVEVAAPAEAIDPICNMSVTIEGALYRSEYEGQTYYFCCAHCQETFEKAHVA